MKQLKEKAMIPQEVIAKFNPALQESVSAVNLPEVQEMIRRLGQYGLAVALPHMHEDGRMVPLPDDMYSYESKLQVSFRRRADSKDEPSLPVMWQCSGKVNSVAHCSAECGVCC
jgi:hypothetical protein